MLQNRDCIVFGDDWGRFPSTIQHIGRVLAESNRLLWIGSLGQRKPTLRPGDLLRAFGKVRRMLSAPPAGESEVVQLHPKFLPFHDVGPVQSINAALLRGAIRHKMRTLKFRDPILLTSTPVVADIVGTLGERSSFYLCLDDYGKFEGAFRSLPGMEEHLLRKVDGCFCISHELAEKRRTKHGPATYIAQGVDTDHFRPAPGELPEPLRHLPRPIIGFFGLLASWVDVDLLCRTAETYPDATLVVIGPADRDVSAFESHRNILYLGKIAYQELPGYARAFDVGLIPFTVNELTIAANPLKLLEYLALEIPVVSTALPEVRKFRPHVSVANNDAEFVRLVGDVLENDTPAKRAARRSVAERYSWRSITGTVASAIVSAEQERSASA